MQFKAVFGTRVAELEQNLQRVAEAENSKGCSRYSGDLLSCTK